MRTLLYKVERNVGNRTGETRCIRSQFVVRVTLYERQFKWHAYISHKGNDLHFSQT